MWSSPDVAGKGGLTQWDQFPQGLANEDAFAGTNVIGTTWWDIVPKSVGCTIWRRQDNSVCLSATPFGQLTNEHGASVPPVPHLFLQETLYVIGHPALCQMPERTGNVAVRRQIFVVRKMSMRQDIGRPSSPLSLLGMLQHQQWQNAESGRKQSVAVSRVGHGRQGTHVPWSSLSKIRHQTF